MRSAKRRFTRDSESGSAALEFLAAGVLLLVPLVYVVVCLSSIQNAQLAVEGAARVAARLYARSGHMFHAGNLASPAIEIVLGDHALRDAPRHVTAQCMPAPQDCSLPRSHVVVEVSVDVVLPGIPDVLSRAHVGIVRIVGRSEQVMSRFASS